MIKSILLGLLLISVQVQAYTLGALVNLQDGSGNAITSTGSALDINVKTGTVAATESGTWTVQPGNTQNSTAWLVQDTATNTSAATAATRGIQTMGIFNTTPTTLTTGQSGMLQLDAAENLLVNLKTAIPTGSNVIGSVTQSGTFTVQPGNTANTTAWLVNDSSNKDTTTGDTGAKTVTFNGATQTNASARGAYITVLCGTVSGTTPTLNAQLQWSPDVGTTWITIGAASANVTATGNTISIWVYPTNFSVAGATPAALVNGATTSLQLNASLPRTWRLTYVIGGTTPSFTITAVYVNYLK